MKCFSKYFSIIMLILPLIYYSCATYTIKLVDEASQSGVSNIPFEVLDLDRDAIAENVGTDEVGEYTIKLSNIPDDSFFVSVSGNADFFPVDERVSKPSKKTIREFILEERTTVIIGHVLDISSYNGIPDCEISTMPVISQKAHTDSKGKFVLNSDEFAEGLEYTIFVKQKGGNYTENRTSITPRINEKFEIVNPIFLEVLSFQDLDTLKTEEIGIPIEIDGPTIN